MNISQIILLVLTILAITSCNQKKAQPPEPRVINYVLIEDIMNEEGCLDLSLFLQKIAKGPSYTQFLEITKGMTAKSKKDIRPNFMKILAYGTFTFERKEYSQISELQTLKQMGCESVVLSDASGNLEKYEISYADKFEIKAKGPSGRIINYRYMSPTMLEVTESHQVYDAPCSRDQEVTIELTKILDWSEVEYHQLKLEDPAYIDPEYLRLVSEAVGYDYNLAYNEERSLVVDQIHYLMEMKPKDEILSCENYQPPVPPSEDEVEVGELGNNETRD